jgi:hypothetical protein
MGKPALLVQIYSSSFVIWEFITATVEVKLFEQN